MATRRPDLSSPGGTRIGRPGPLARDSLWSLAAILQVGLSAAAFNALVGRFLGQAALGQAGLVLAIGLGGAQVATAGLAPAITRFGAARLAAGDPAGARRALGGGLAVAIGLGAGLAIALLRLGPERVEGLGLPPGGLVASAGLLALQSAYIALKAALYGLGRVGAYARSELPAALAFAAFLAALLAGAPLSLVSPFLAANLVFTLRAAWLLARAWPERRAAGEAPPAAAPAAIGADAARVARGTRMPRYALIASVGSAAALARLQLVLLFTAALWSVEEVGRLQAALTFLPPVLLLPRALELALLPRLAHDWGGADRASFRRRTDAALRLSALGLSLAAGGLGLAAGWLLPALFGAEFGVALPALRWTLLAAWSLGLASPAVTALSGADGVAVPNAAGLAGLATSLLAWAIWLPEGGASAAAAGLAAGSLVNAGIPLVWAIRRYQLAARPLLASLSRSGLLLLAGGLLLARWPRAALGIALAYVVLLALWEGRRLWPGQALRRAAAPEIAR